MNENKKNEFSISSLSEKLIKLEKEMKNVSEQLKMVGGDISDNADWKILNEKLESMQKKFFFLKRDLFLAKNETESKNLITYRILETDEEKTIQLTKWDIDPEKSKISTVSPLGLALLDKKVGEISEVRTRKITYKVQIISIK